MQRIHQQREEQQQILKNRKLTNEIFQTIKKVNLNTAFSTTITILPSITVTTVCTGSCFLRILLLPMHPQSLSLKILISILLCMEPLRRIAAISLLVLLLAIVFAYVDWLAWTNIMSYGRRDSYGEAVIEEEENTPILEALNQ